MAIHTSIFCLENPMDSVTWPAIVHGKKKSQTWPSHTFSVGHCDYRQQFKDFPTEIINGTLAGVREVFFFLLFLKIGDIEYYDPDEWPSKGENKMTIQGQKWQLMVQYPCGGKRGENAGQEWKTDLIQEQQLSIVVKLKLSFRNRLSW